MPFDAKVIRVVIASPSDTADARQVLKTTIEEWNGLHGESTGIMLLALMWERDATPEMGQRPQEILNRQLIDAADILIGIFWTRLGTPTSEADSGTVEEIDRAYKAGKPVLLYFSSVPVVPQSIDQEQYARLTEFRDNVMKRALVDSFASLDELRWKSSAALIRTIRDRFVGSDDDLPSTESALEAKREKRAVIIARIDREREITAFSSRGQPRYSTRERLVIENRGTGAAEDLTVGIELPEEADGAKPTVFVPGPIGRLVPGAAVDFPLLRAFGTSSRWDVFCTWREGDAWYEERQSMS
jgi:nucleoside 2-deoxyribosyltransferase